jgi:DNA repair protein RadA/Sms
LEVQALVDECHGGMPRRVAVGMEQNRLAMLLAVLHRHGGIPILSQDVFINLVGGLRLGETAGDLPVLLAIASSYRDRPLPRDWIAFGEVGLNGEVRPVANGEERLREAVKQGFKHALVPKANAPRAAIDGMTLFPVRSLREALEAI